MGADAAARAVDALQRRAYFSRRTYFVGQELALQDTVATALRDTAAAGRARRHLAALADGTRKER